MTTTVEKDIPSGVLTFEEIKAIADNGWAIIKNPEYEYHLDTYNSTRISLFAYKHAAFHHSKNRKSYINTMYKFSLVNFKSYF